MMMTCRLLCALLVLALCCCPSVCVSEEATAQPVPEGSSNTTTTTTTAPEAPSTTTTEAPAVDHPRTVTSSRNRRQPQQLCVGVCPAAARRIRSGVHRSGLKRCVRAVRASTQPRGLVRVCCGSLYK
ncbi:mucin TcMUCII [Trypanosoma cruzi]|nr:mucin TcMUCII [Trypanosoma cruzi]